MLKILAKIVRKINAFSLIVILLISFVTVVIVNMFPAGGGQNTGETEAYYSHSSRAPSTSTSSHKSSAANTGAKGKRSQGSMAGKTVLPPYRVVHLDLKGAPPKLSYLREVLPLLAQAGANALLVEYEDMFPYSGAVANASALNSWSPDHITQLVGLAEDYGFEVIPLIQTFGHMEHLLKLEEFSHLREMGQYPQAICPSHKGSFPIIRQMVDQVLKAHPRAKHLHIGCDEVFQLGVCSKCRESMRRMAVAERRNSSQKPSGAVLRRHRPDRHVSPRHLYLDHVKRVADYVRKATDNTVTPLIWDDMLRSISYEELKASDLASHGVQPVVWVYVEDIDHFVDAETWNKYARLFPNGVWAASAFKGAFGERLFMPNTLRHYANHLSWIEVINREGRHVNFRGIVLTGWSRYDHFAVLCELLPTAIPSLVLNLLTMAGSYSDENHRFQVAARLLNCTGRSLDPASLQADPHQFELRRCNFPGSEIYGAVGSLAHFKVEVESLDTNSRESQGWLTSYNVRHNYSSPWRLSEAVGGHEYLVKALSEYSDKTSGSLSKIYEAPTVAEWIEQNVYPLQEKTEKLLALIDRLTSRRVWPRRPIP